MSMHLCAQSLPGARGRKQLHPSSFVLCAGTWFHRLMKPANIATSLACSVWAG